MADVARTYDGETVDDRLVAFAILEDEGRTGGYDRRSNSGRIIRTLAGNGERLAVGVNAAGVIARRDNDLVAVGVSRFDRAKYGRELAGHQQGPGLTKQDGDILVGIHRHRIGAGPGYVVVGSAPAVHNISAVCDCDDRHHCAVAVIFTPSMVG